MRELHGFLVGEVVEDIGSADDAGVGRHEAVDIGPNLEDVGIDSRGYERGCVVGAAASECCGFAFLVG